MNKKEDYDTVDVISSFPDEEQSRIREIWDKTGKIPPPGTGVSDEHVEQALKLVHRKMDLPATEKTYSIYHLRKWVAAAAILLLAFTVGYLLTPQTVTAPYGEMVATELPDGTVAELNSGTEISYHRLFPYWNRTVDLNGEAFFSAESEGRNPLLIEANSSSIEVTGTEFNVRSWSEEPDRQTEVSVAEGYVRLYPSNQPDRYVELSEGMLSRWNPEMDEPTDPEKAALDEVIGWRENRLVFNNQPLWKIFREIERRFDIRIQLNDEDITNETLTAHYSDPDNAEQIIEDISRVKGLRFSKTANGFRIYQ